VFPSSLSASQRARLHEAAESAGIAHASRGEGEQRCIVLGPDDGVETVLQHEGAVPEELLSSWARLHLEMVVPPPNTVAVPPACRRAAPSQPSVVAFVAATLPLLELEHAAEVSAGESLLASSVVEAARRGDILLALRVVDISPGFLGRTVLTLSRGEGALLPDHRLGTHDLVALRASRGGHESPLLARGVVSRVTETTLAVALDEAPEEQLDGLLRVERLANDVTHARLKAALASLSAVGAGSARPPGAPLVDLLFGRCAPRPPSAPSARPVALLNAALDASQEAAVRFALTSPELVLIHGPPGTGKTTAVVEAILQFVARGERVLACASSNIAVDNLLERLRSAAPSSLRCVRLGHPARLSPTVLDACLEAVVARADSTALAADVRREMRTLTQRLSKLGPRERAERRDARRQLSQLAREERTREKAAVREVLAGCTVVAATLTGSLSRTLKDAARERPFDVVVIDEAAQSLEAAAWGALLMGRRAVLAGDHLQLPPTVLSDAAAQGGLSRTLFERAHAAHGTLCRMLTVQYRMHARIADWASGELYDGRLSAPESVATRTLAHFNADFPVLLHIDTAGCDLEESDGDGAESKSNEGEARTALAHVSRLLAAGVPAQGIGVITPYRAQVTLLRELRAAGGPALEAVEISTVDGFQGREKEAIVISCVRSNAAGAVGFLSDRRRFNVAVTRARRHVALVGDSETLRRDAFLGRLCDWFGQHGEIASAAEYVQ